MTYWINDSYANQTFFYGDCYSFGKSLAILARLALVADELGETGTRFGSSVSLRVRVCVFAVRGCVCVAACHRHNNAFYVGSDGANGAGQSEAAVERVV